MTDYQRLPDKDRFQSTGMHTIYNCTFGCITFLSKPHPRVPIGVLIIDIDLRRKDRGTRWPQLSKEYATYGTRIFMSFERYGPANYTIRLMI